MAILKSNQLHQKVKENLRQTQFFITDADYATPSKKWIQGEFFNLYRKWLWDHNLFTWKEYGDCDNFAFTFYCFANMCHAKTMQIRERQGLPTVQGISVGIMFFKQKNYGGHAINFIVTEDEFLYLEPQNGQWLNLSKEERESCWFAVC